MAKRSRSSSSRSHAPSSSRPLWRGHLKLSLVSCPIALYNAITESEEIHLHFLNPETGNRIRYQSVDAETEEVLDRADLVRGYEFQKDRYVTLTNEELDDLKIESSTVMNVEEFVDAGDIDPRYFEHAYYVAPDGEAGLDAYVVIRAAMAKSGRFAITRAVIARKERVIAMKPFDRGIIGYALRERAEIRPEKDLFRDIGSGSVDKDALAIAMKLVQQKSAKFDPDRFEDRYESRLRQLIDAKLKGVELEPEEIEEAPKVVNLLDALRRSLDDGKRKPSNDNEGKRKSATVHKFTKPHKTKTSTRTAVTKKKPRKRA